MSLNYYAGQTEAWLLEKRGQLQEQLDLGRQVEVRLGGELTRFDQRDNCTSLELSLIRIFRALDMGSPWPSGNSYDNPDAPRITPQSHY